MKKLVKHYYKNDLVRGSSYLFIGSIFTNVLSYLFHLVTGRMLGPSQYAVIASLISITYVLGFVSQLINTTVTRKVAELTGKEDLSGVATVVKKMLKYVVVFDVIFIVIVLFLQNYIAAFLHIENSYLISIIIITLLIGLIASIFDATLQGQIRFLGLTIIHVITALIRVVAAYIAIQMGYGVEGVVFSLLLTSSIILFILGYMNKHLLIYKVKQHQSLITKTSMVATIWIGFALIGKAAMINVDLLIVKHFFSDFDAGLYAGLSTIGKSALFVSSAIGIVLLPIVSRSKARGKSSHKELMLSLLLITVLTFGVIGAFYIFPNIVVHLFYGSEYDAIGSYLWLIGIYFLFYNLSFAFVSYYVAQKETLVLSVPLVAAILQVILLWIFHNTFYQILYSLIATSVLLFGFYGVYYMANVSKET